MVDNRKDKFLTSFFVWCSQNQVCNFLCFCMHGVWLSIRAFDGRSRGPRFKSGCPLCLWWTIEKTNFSLLVLFDVVKIKYAISFAFVLSFWMHGVWLSIRAFDGRSRGPRFKSRCPLCLWWTIEKTNFSLLVLFDVVKIKYAIYLFLFWA